ncbi:hypothetical protein VP150E351_P0092 [Vibrio phage 150E35-1]|nr:hypothetical protein VP150E351_P0092 [Vibrio phage 150E35-1]
MTEQQELLILAMLGVPTFAKIFNYYLELCCYLGIAP